MTVTYPLKEPSSTRGRNVIIWRRAMPFVWSQGAQLVHRPRSIYQFDTNGWEYTYGGRCSRDFGNRINFYCGGVAHDKTNAVWFMDDIPDGYILCERCEDAAVEAGLPSANRICGRHIHVGRCQVMVTCCPGGLN